MWYLFLVFSFYVLLLFCSRCCAQYLDYSDVLDRMVQFGLLPISTLFVSQCCDFLFVFVQLCVVL